MRKLQAAVKRALGARAWLLPLALVVGACGRPPRHPMTSADAALERLRDQTACSRAVQGEAALSFSGAGRRLRGKVLYLAHAPDQLRFDVFSSFGVTLSTLTSDGSKFSLYNLEERSFLYGTASACNVARFTQVPVPPAALVELLRGRPPVLVHATDGASIRYRGGFLSPGRYEIRVAGQHDSVETIELGLFPEDWALPPERQRLRLLRVLVTQAGRSLYEVDLSGHARRTRLPSVLSPEEMALGLAARPPSGPECSAEVPGKLDFYVPETGYAVSFENREVHHNPPLAAETFSQSVPSGVVVQRSACDGS